MKGLLQGFRNLGYVDGQNVILEPRSAEGKYERDFQTSWPNSFARRSTSSSQGGTLTTASAKKATTTIPIVAVEAGFVTSFARPGGNITGLAFLAELMPNNLRSAKKSSSSACR
jgi:putative ABC transport system substrate-binding protein